MDFRLNLAARSVSQAQPEEPLVVSRDIPFREVLTLMQRRNRGSVMVCGADGLLQGIFTERDAVKLMARSAAGETPVSELMTRDPATVKLSDSVATAIGAMAKGGYRRLPVVDDAGRPVGVLGVSRLLEYVVEHIPEVVYTLPPKPLRTSSEREGA